MDSIYIEKIVDALQRTLQKALQKTFSGHTSKFSGHTPFHTILAKALPNTAQFILLIPLRAKLSPCEVGGEGVSLFVYGWGFGFSW